MVGGVRTELRHICHITICWRRTAREAERGCIKKAARGFHMRLSEAWRVRRGLVSSHVIIYLSDREKSALLPKNIHYLKDDGTISLLPHCIIYVFLS